MQEIVGGVVRHHDLVAKMKIAKFFLAMFVRDSRKFMLAKISHYTVYLLIAILLPSQRF